MGRTVLLTGAAGFIGSHLVDALLERGDRVLAYDNLSTGQARNVAHHFDPGAVLDDPRMKTRATGAAGQLRWRHADVCEGMYVPPGWEPDVVMHLASPASPHDYPRIPMETMRVNSIGTERALEVASTFGARFVFASTSEVYGDPAVHPQPEEYWGNVNSYGPRSVYDEAKRYGEALCHVYAEHRGLDVVVLRIFNAYGPRLRVDDGRVVSEFITRAARGYPLLLQGGGAQTRSFCYIDDMVAGILAAADSGLQGPVNVGNPKETKISDLAKFVVSWLTSDSELVESPMPVDDPTRRCPDISRLSLATGWSPAVSITAGMERTIAYFLHLEAEADAAVMS